MNCTLIFIEMEYDFNLNIQQQTIDVADLAEAPQLCDTHLLKEDLELLIADYAVYHYMRRDRKPSYLRAIHNRIDPMD